MELTYVREFVVLADIKKFSAAAQKLHISQPTLSRHIQTLETELNCLLFDRTTREMELSDFGQLFLPYAKKLVHVADAAQVRLREYTRQQVQTVRIGVVHNPDLFQIIDYLMEFRNLYPDYSLSITEGTVSDLSAELSDGRLKLITVSCAQWEPVPERFVLSGKSRLCALLSRKHPLASLDILPLSRLENEKLILPEKNNIVYQYLTHILREKNVHPNIIYQGSSSGVAAPLRSGMGIMIQDEAVAARYLNDDVILRKLEPEISYVFGLAYSESLSAAERAFVRFVEQRFQPDTSLQ